MFKKKEYYGEEVELLKENNSDLSNQVKNLQETIRGNKLTQELVIKELNHKHKLELEQKEFDMKHFKDEELKTARDEAQKAKADLDIAKKENEMLDKIVNINADIIDVKELVNGLINKLPEINLTSLSVQAPNGK